MLWSIILNVLGDFRCMTSPNSSRSRVSWLSPCMDRWEKDRRIGKVVFRFLSRFPRRAREVVVLLVLELCFLLLDLCCVFIFSPFAPTDHRRRQASTAVAKTLLGDISPFSGRFVGPEVELVGFFKDEMESLAR